MNKKHFSYGLNNVMTNFFFGGGASQEDILGYILGLAISLIFDQFSIL